MSTVETGRSSEELVNQAAHAACQLVRKTFKNTVPDDTLGVMAVSHAMDVVEGRSTAQVDLASETAAEDLARVVAARVKTVLFQRQALQQNAQCQFGVEGMRRMDWQELDGAFS